MKFDKLFRTLAPVAPIALAAGLAGCKDASIVINDEEGVPLAALDMSGDPPDELVLAGPDSVVVTTGKALDINVEGDAEAVEALRFTLKDGTLGVMRGAGFKDLGGKLATVRVTMPAPEKIVIAGSGGVAAQAMANKGEVVIAGSGRLDLAYVDADELDVNVVGSGTFGAAGKVRKIDLTVAGAGSMEAPGLSVDEADVTIMGSGDADFASNGTVKAKIMGSGDVTVTGSATCTIEAMGSGKVICRPGTAAGE
ncbi:MAG: head GIN domain-containing protein [Sphingomonadaceae bacterium]